MVAKQGDAQVWHFAHYRAENCAAGFESALHLAVKRILAEEKRLLLPHCGVVRHPIPIKGLPIQGRDRNATCFDVFEYTKANAKALASSYFKIPDWGTADLPGRLVSFDEVFAEKTEGDIRPDIIGVVDGRRIFIEVAVTHFIDKVKLRRIRDRGVATLEIVVPPTTSLDWEALRTIIVAEQSGKFWRFNPRAEQSAEASYAARVRATEALALERKSVYETRYKPILEVILRGRAGIVTVSLTPSFVTLKWTSNRFGDYLEQTLRKRGNCHFNAYYGRWEFPPLESVFIDLAQELKTNSYLAVEQVRAPTALQKSEIWSRLGYPRIASELLAASEPPTS